MLGTTLADAQFNSVALKEAGPWERTCRDLAKVDSRFFEDCSASQEKTLNDCCLEAA
jgi:hypothetical protein